MELEVKIIESAKEIFSTMIMMEIEVSDEKVSDHSALQDSISGIIGLAGKCKGVLAIHLPNTVAMAITGNFLGMEVTEMNEDVEDAVGELANMLGGNVKTILSERGRDIELSMPSTISGKNYDFQTSKNADRYVIPFVCEAGKFSVDVQLEK